MTEAKSGKAALKISGGAAAAAASDFSMEFAFGDDQKMNMHATVKAATGSTEIIVVGGATYLKLPKAVNGKTWFKSSDAAAAAAADPTAIAKGFAGATVKDVGEEGDLHHYTLQTAGTDGVLDVYLDQDGRPAKLKGTTSGVTIDGTYSDWGADVSITAPPADQVTSTMG